MSRRSLILVLNRAKPFVLSFRWIEPVVAAAAGYCIALAIWMSRAENLDAFIFKNELAIGLRRDLLLALIGGAVAGVLVWLTAGFLVSRVTRDRRGWAWTAAALSFGIAAPVAPVLFLPDIQSTAPVFSLALIALAAALVGISIRALIHIPVVEGQPSVEAEETLPVAQERRQWQIGLGVTLALAVGYAVVMAGLTVAKHNAYNTNAFDLAIHDQAIYNILHSGYMRSTVYGPYAINYIGDHFSPLLFLLAPIYFLRADARTLLVLQSIFLAAAAVPLYLLARLKTRSVWIALALAVAYLLHPALHGINLADFHQIALVIVLLLSALYFLEAERDVPFLIALVLAVAVKEEVALTAAAIGAYVFLAKRRRALGAGIAVVSLLYFGAVIGWVMPQLGGTPQIDTRFGGYIAPGAQGAAGVAWTLLTNPIFTLAHIFGDPAKRLFLLQMFLPVLFLPLLAPARAWLVALPSLAVLTLTSAHTQYDINAHYSAHLLPVVFFLATLGIARIRRTASGRVIAPVPAVVGALAVATLGATLLYGKLLPTTERPWAVASEHDRVVDRFVAEIPREAVVSALGGIVPHLSARKTIYLFPDVADAEYLLLDTSQEANYWPYEGLEARDKSLTSMTEVIRSGKFGLARDEDGVFLFQAGRDPSGNEAAIARMLSTRYEAEALPSDFTGSIITDPQASGGKARTATSEMRGTEGKMGLVYGPYTDLQPGNYRAAFVIKASGVPADTQALTIDVFTHIDGYPRASRAVFGRDFKSSDFTTFTLDFNTSGQPLEDVEFRAMVDGVGAVSVDRIDLEYLGR